MKKTHLLMIDPQNDFCNPKGALFAPGADDDMARLATFINTNSARLGDIHCTLDSHQSIHIAHPPFWVNSDGKNPDPFTLITADDVRSGKWRPYNPKWHAKAQTYVDTLAKNNRYVLCVWPIHCRIGSWGHALVPDIADALYSWEVNRFSRVNFVAKGSNLFTEHYSGVMADVPDDNDPSTKLNGALIDALIEADEILITGEALSHCVSNTVRDIAVKFGDDNIKKFTLLEDTTSNVPGFEQLGQDFVKEFVGRGMKTVKTTEW